MDVKDFNRHSVEEKKHVCAVVSLYRPGLDGLDERLVDKLVLALCLDHAGALAAQLEHNALHVNLARGPQRIETNIDREKRPRAPNTGAAVHHDGARRRRLRLSRDQRGFNEKKSRKGDTMR